MFHNKFPCVAICDTTFSNETIICKLLLRLNVNLQQSIKSSTCRSLLQSKIKLVHTQFQECQCRGNFDFGLSARAAFIQIGTQYNSD